MQLLSWNHLYPDSWIKNLSHWKHLEQHSPSLLGLNGTYFLLLNTLTLSLGLWSNLCPSLRARFPGTGSGSWSSTMVHQYPKLAASCQWRVAQDNLSTSSSPMMQWRGFTATETQALWGLLIITQKYWKQAWASHLPINMSLSNPYSAPTYS